MRVPSDRSCLAPNASQKKTLKIDVKYLQIVKYFGFVASFVCASAYAFVVATSNKLHDMFHLLRMNVAIAYILVRDKFYVLN